MASFRTAELITGKNEGGYVNDPTDKGGETLNGISRKAWPNWEGWVKLDKIINQVGTHPTAINTAVKLNDALQMQISNFYKSNFWDINNLDVVANQQTANKVYDIGVNMGVVTAAKMLQEALNLCNKNQLSYKDISEDGIISKNGETLQVLNNFANPTAVLNTLVFLQGEKYLKIMRTNKSQEKFWDGWLKRAITKN